MLRVAMATLTVDPEEKDLRIGRPCTELALSWSQVVRLSASNVGITERHLSAPPQRVEGIGTDADISRGRGGYVRFWVLVVKPCRSKFLGWFCQNVYQFRRCADARGTTSPGE